MIIMRCMLHSQVLVRSSFSISGCLRSTTRVLMHAKEAHEKSIKEAEKGPFAERDSLIFQ